MEERRGNRGPRGRLRPAAVCLLLAVTLGNSALVAQGWSGSLGIAAIGQSTDGSPASFFTQTQLDKGLTLEELRLRYEGEEGSEFTLEARGFGDAEPSEAARLDWKLASPWRLSFDYDHRESFFGLQTTELGLRSDEWEIDRFRASVEYDGWKAARLGLDLRAYERSGTVVRPLFGLNALYPLAVDLDETMQEVAFRLETRATGRVRLLFEQALATYERNNQRRPADELDLSGSDPDLFAGASDSREEQRDVPTTRVTVTYGGDGVEVIGSLLWSPGELEGPGIVSEAFGIGGGSIGRVEFIDQVIGSADLDVFNGNLRLGFRLAPAWVLRLEGEVRDRSTDAALLGQRLVRITNPLGGEFELGATINESTLFDVSEDHERLTLEWKGGGWTVWGGAFVAGRDVDWRIGSEDPGFSAQRDSDGFLLGAAWSRGAVSGSAEYERGDFEELVFRTDPETVDRLSLRLSAALGGGWDLSLRGRVEEADNPAADPDRLDLLDPAGVPAGLDRSSDAFGLGLTWNCSDGVTGIGLDLDQLDLTTETGLVLPGAAAGLSLYDLSLLTTTLHGRTEAGRARISGSVTRLDDSGDTWPLESWIARARVGMEVAPRTELAVFGEYWSYDEERADLDDYDVTRWGVAFHWRFE